MKKTFITGTVLVSLLAAPVQAQGIFGDIGKVLNGDGGLIGALIRVFENLLFKDVEDATPDKTCQPRSDAQSLVDGQVYGENSAEEGFICNGVKVKGLKGEEVNQWAEELHKAQALTDAESGSTSYTMIDRKGRTKVVDITWTDVGYTETETDIIVAQGVTIAGENTEFAERPFYKVNVKTRLNLRSAVGAKDSSTITGQYKGGDIVQVISFENTTPDKCETGRWALISSRGAGVGYVCANYLVDAPVGTTLADVDQFMKPRTGGFGSGATRYSKAKVKGRSKSKRISTAVSELDKNNQRKKTRRSEKTQHAQTVRASYDD